MELKNNYSFIVLKAKHSSNKSYLNAFVITYIKFLFCQNTISIVHFISFYYNFANNSMEYTTFSNMAPKHLKGFDFSEQRNNTPSNSENVVLMGYTLHQ